MVARAREIRNLAGFILPAVVMLAAVAIFPSLYLIWMSLQHWIVFQPEVTFNGLENFRHLLASPDFQAAVRVTAVYLAATTTLTLALGLALALVLTEEMRGRGVLRAIFTLPLVVPPVVAGFAWKFTLNREVGVIGAYVLPKLGIEVSLLGHPIWALVSVLVADVWSKTSFMFLVLLAGLQSIPSEVREAAIIDGVSRWQEVRFVVLPLLLPVMLVATVFRLLDGINTFDLIYVLTRGGPGTATQTLSILGWKIGFQYFDLGQAAALAIVMLVVVIGMAFPLMRRLVV